MPAPWVGRSLKPYVSGDSILIDAVQADCFFPTAFDTSGRMTGAVFVEQIVRGNRIYTRAESHEFMTRPGGHPEQSLFLHDQCRLGKRN